MCWTRHMKKSYIIADIFWTRHDSVKLLKMYHLVLIFDCTYKTSRYWLPLLETVGANSTKLTFSVRFAYMEHENEENFTWASEKSNELFTLEKLPPKVMMTDQELSLLNAIEVVFTSLFHLLYVFHISKKNSKFKSESSMLRLICKSLLWIYGTKSCNQIGALSLSNNCNILR